MADPNNGSATADADGKTYDARFERGHRFRLLDRPRTFHLSTAGLALGDYLVRNLRENEISGRILEIGTGSGAIALLLRSMGAHSIAATDICSSALATASQNEVANFGDSIVDFSHHDLFPGPATRWPQPYDLIVFNPPGWRAPSERLEAELLGKHRSLDLEAMFYGDGVVLRFLQHLPEHLAAGGRAIVGLNSLLGIADIFERCRSSNRSRTDSPIVSRLLERIEIPLLFYTDEWRAVRESLLAQFERGREDYEAAYVVRDDVVHWFYEITEITVSGSGMNVASGTWYSNGLDPVVR